MVRLLCEAAVIELPTMLKFKRYVFAIEPVSVNALKVATPFEAEAEALERLAEPTVGAVTSPVTVMRRLASGPVFTVLP